MTALPGLLMGAASCDDGVPVPVERSRPAAALAIAPALTPLFDGDNPLSAHPPTDWASGWGPYDRDQSNGEQGAGDGNPLTIAGASFARGIGVHLFADGRPASVVYDLAGACTSFAALVGVDDEVADAPWRIETGAGAVEFTVVVDGAVRYTSGVVRVGDAAVPVEVDVRGAQRLELVAGDGGDGFFFDHADWAEARVRCGGVYQDVAAREPWLWPFAADSIWNTPIGADARYAAAEIPSVWSLYPDIIYLLPLRADDPVRPLYQPAAWTKRCGGTANQQHPGGKSIPFPDHRLVADAVVGNGVYFTPNSVASLLMPDGITLLEIEPLARCSPKGPVHGWTVDAGSVTGDGLRGAQLDTEMSGIGGLVRMGELTGPWPIRHALQVGLWGEKFVYRDEADASPGFRWPALRYRMPTNGTNPELEMGALLALPPSVTAEALGIKTPVGRKLMRALQDFGAYLTTATSSTSTTWRSRPSEHRLLAALENRRRRLLSPTQPAPDRRNSCRTPAVRGMTAFRR